jgi:hypothetical protein
MARLDADPGAAYAANPVAGFAGPEPERLTLLDLVRAVAESSRSEAEVVAVVEHLIATGRVSLIGQFREPHLLRD